MDFSKALELIQQKLAVWVRELIKMMPNLLLAVLILIVGIYISRLIARVSRRVIDKLAHVDVITNLGASFIYITGIGISIFTALSVLQLDKALTSLLAGAGIVGLALAFAFQDIAANFMSGILLSMRRPLRVGDIVKLQDYMGRVESVNLRDVTLLTFQGQMVIIPNKEVMQNPIENYSLLGRRRMDLSVGVSYGEDLQKVKDVTMAAVEDISGLAPDETVSFFYQEFADSSINFTLRLWASTPDQPDYLRVRSEAIMKIKKAYDENGITIPFPIRTLDFGIKGGQKLDEMPLTIVANGKDKS